MSTIQFRDSSLRHSMVNISYQVQNSDDPHHPVNLDKSDNNNDGNSSNCRKMIILFIHYFLLFN